MVSRVSRDLTPEFTEAGLVCAAGR
jgi:hypothetical protein